MVLDHTRGAHPTTPERCLAAVTEDGSVRDATPGVVRGPFVTWSVLGVFRFPPLFADWKYCQQTGVVSAVGPPFRPNTFDSGLVGNGATGERK